jgi:hypothetical protein
MRVELLGEKFLRREIRLWTSKNIWSFSLRKGIVRFSFKKLEAAIDKLVSDERAQILEKLGGEEYLKKAAEQDARIAETAREAGEADILRYSIMLDQYKRFGECQQLKQKYDVQEATAWRPADDHRLPT